jgi:hypothetical protein
MITNCEVGMGVWITAILETGTVSKVRQDDHGEPIIEVTRDRDGETHLCRNFEIRPLRKAYIRPTYKGDQQVGYALTTCKDKPSQDCEVLDHFGLDHNGREITEVAREFHQREAVWGDVLNIK